MVFVLLSHSTGCQSTKLASDDVVRTGTLEGRMSGARPAAARSQSWKAEPATFSASSPPTLNPASQSDAGQADLPASEPSETCLTLKELEILAFQHNPALAAAAARMNAARGRKHQAGLYPNPVMGYHATEIGNRDTAGQQGGFVNQRFITGNKLQLDQAIATREIDEAHFRFHAQERRILSDVRSRFCEAVVAQQRMELTQELEALGSDLVTATQQLLKSRLGTENDLLQARIKAEESAILADNAQNQRIESWRRLMAVVGTPTLPMGVLQDESELELPAFDWEECRAIVMHDNPQLNAARMRTQRARRVISRAKAEPVPNVDLSVSVRHHNVTDSDVANVQLGIPVPVFNRNQGNVRSAEAEWVAACKDAERIELALLDQLALTYRQYQNARQQVERYRERMIPQARQSLDLVSDAYETGQVDYQTLLTSQQTFVRVNLDYLDALLEARTSAIAIEGQLLLGSLSNRP